MQEPYPGPDDIRLAAELCGETLLPLADGNWNGPAAGLEWSARFTLEHAAQVPLVYATHLATRSQRRVPIPFCYNPDTSIADLLAILAARAAVLAEVVQAAPAEARGFHPVGRADPSGFAAMGCDEMLIHTDDLARTFGVPFTPPSSLCRRVLHRLFPWAPETDDPWAALRWANGRAALPDRGRLGPGEWTWQCAPLEEWDGAAPPES